jgi:ABC-type tungstate transport system permease subunit
MRKFTLALLAMLGLASTSAVADNDLARDRAGRVIEADRPGGFARPRQVYLMQDGKPATIENPNAALSPRYVDESVYPSNAPDTVIRIANGGAGAAGLIEALAHAYLRSHPKDEHGHPYAIAWYLTDTTFSIAALDQQIVDIAVTYDEKLERKAVADGYATRRDLIFMDHFLIVGPRSNPAALARGDDSNAAFLKIADHGCARPFTDPPATDCAYFLSRDDKSATEIKERQIFDTVFATSDRHSNLRDRGYLDGGKAAWYYLCPKTPQACFPPVALARSNDGRLYTLTDWGTWLANGGLQGKLPNLEIYLSGVERSGQPILLNPANGLLSAQASPDSRRFYDWLLAADGGQAVIRGFGADRYGQPLYTLR